MPTNLTVYTDTDWAGCTRTRKSTSGGCITFGTHNIKCWSTTQAVIALSSGEAEFYGIVKGASVLLGAPSLARDMGVMAAAVLAQAQARRVAPRAAARLPCS